MLGAVSPSDRTILQETEFQVVESYVSNDGERRVRKTYKRPNHSLQIEAAFLEATSKRAFRHLSLPTLIEKGERSLSMTFVERENQTRDSILERTWSRQDVRTLASAIRELQTVPLPRSRFSAKQRLMGLVYPVVKLLLIRAACVRQGIIGSRDYWWLFQMAVQYLFARAWVRNCTVHYDLTTLNCAFAPDGRVSILDFEFPYYLGDSMFDACYFATIPPQSMANWTFQKQLIVECIGHGEEFAQARCRLILTVCCLVRALFFGTGSRERSQYLESLEMLRNRRWFAGCLGCS